MESISYTSARSDLAQTMKKVVEKGRRRPCTHCNYLKGRRGGCADFYGRLSGTRRNRLFIAQSQKH
ncbi:MAG: hypothetical protein ACI9EW_003467, partial [Cellvibrionaceae bacterium]